MKINKKYVVLISAIIIVLIYLVITQITKNKYSIDDLKKILEDGIAMNENNYIKTEKLIDGKSQLINETYKDGDIIYYHQEDENKSNFETIKDFSQNTEVLIVHESKKIFKTTIVEDMTENVFLPNEQAINALNEFKYKIKYCGKTKINNVECLKFYMEGKISDEKLKGYCYINSKNKLIMKIKNGKEEDIITYEKKELNKETLKQFDINNYDYEIKE